MQAPAIPQGWGLTHLRPGTGRPGRLVRSWAARSGIRRRGRRGCPPLDGTDGPVDARKGGCERGWVAGPARGGGIADRHGAPGILELFEPPVQRLQRLVAVEGGAALTPGAHPLPRHRRLAAPPGRAAVPGCCHRMRPDWLFSACGGHARETWAEHGNLVATSWMPDNHSQTSSSASVLSPRGERKSAGAASLAISYWNGKDNRPEQGQASPCPPPNSCASRLG